MNVSLRNIHRRIRKEDDEEEIKKKKNCPESFIQLEMKTVHFSKCEISIS